VTAVIAAARGPDCGLRTVGENNQTAASNSRCTSFVIRSPRDSHTDAALARTRSLFRFASVASRPRFSHDPVNLAPDCDG